MNEVFSPNTVVTSSSPPESPVESKRDDRKRKEVQLQAAMEGEKGVMDALKHQMAYRDGKISSLQEKYKSSLKSIAELEEKLSSQSKSNAETNMVSCFDAKNSHPLSSILYSNKVRSVTSSSPNKQKRSRNSFHSLNV